MCHTNGDLPVSYLVEAGADSVEHGNFVSENTLKQMAKSSIVWVPTVTVTNNMIGCGRFSDSLLQSLYERGIGNIRKGLAMGVTMALGSDAGAYLVPHGQGLLDEWECFKECVEDTEELKQYLLKGEARIKEKFRRG